MSDEMEGEFIAQQMIADAQLRDLQDYLRRGRPYARTPLAELRKLLIASMRLWSQDVTSRPLQLSDATSEYELRRIEPPYEDLTTEIDLIAAMAQKLHREMPRRKRDELLNSITDEYVRRRKVTRH